MILTVEPDRLHEFVGNAGAIPLVEDRGVSNPLFEKVAVSVALRDVAESPAAVDFILRDRGELVGDCLFESFVRLAGAAIHFADQVEIARSSRTDLAVFESNVTAFRVEPPEQARA